MTDRKRKDKKTCIKSYCRRVTWENDGYCIFHSKDIVSKKYEFEDAFRKEFDRQKEQDEEYDFRGFVFPGDISFKDREFEKAAKFRWAQFSGWANFSGAQFSERANFLGAQFSERAYFWGAQFYKEAEFFDAKFSETAGFLHAQFSGDSNFEEAKFSEMAEFSEATFEGEAKFNNIRCLESIRFRSSRFCSINSDSANFSLSKFKGNIDFNGAEFGISDSLYKDISNLSTDKIKESKKYLGLSPEVVTKIKSLKQYQINTGKVTFTGIEVDGIAIFNGTKIWCKEADFREAKFYKKLEFKIEKDYIKKISMVETYIFDLMGDKGRLGGETGNDYANRGLLEGLDQINKEQEYFHWKWRFLNLSEIIRRIEIKFRKLATFIIPCLKYKPKLFIYLSEKFTPILGEHAEARYPIAAKHIKDDRFLMRFRQRHGFVFWIWWLLANCGRSLWRWAFWSLFFAFFFAVIFYSSYSPEITNFSIDHINYKAPFLTFFYYSVVTFTTLGFGDITPKTDGMKILVMIEVILGYIMLGGLITILANKLARRS